MGRSGNALGFQMLFNCGFIKGVGLALFNGDGSQWAFAEAGAQSVAEFVGSQNSLAVDDGDGSFGAGWYALSASVAFIGVDFYDISQHGCDSPLSICVVKVFAKKPGQMCRSVSFLYHVVFRLFPCL